MRYLLQDLYATNATKYLFCCVGDFEPWKGDSWTWFFYPGCNGLFSPRKTTRLFSGDCIGQHTTRKYGWNHGVGIIFYRSVNYRCPPGLHLQAFFSAAAPPYVVHLSYTAKNTRYNKEFSANSKARYRHTRKHFPRKTPVKSMPGGA